jgi:hypothetical protein
MLTVKQIEPIIGEKRGNIAAVARHFKVSRQALYKHINKSPVLQAALDEARETMVDNAEGELYEQALSGNTSALIFFLKTQGKRRGYTERQEVTGADGGPVETRDVSERNARTDAAHIAEVLAILGDIRGGEDGSDADARLD